MDGNLVKRPIVHAQPEASVIFLLKERTGAPKGLWRAGPASSNSFSCLLSSANSGGDIRYGNRGLFPTRSDGQSCVVELERFFTLFFRHHILELGQLRTNLRRYHSIGCFAVLLGYDSCEIGGVSLFQSSLSLER